MKEDSVIQEVSAPIEVAVKQTTGRDPLYFILIGILIVMLGVCIGYVYVTMPVYELINQINSDFYLFILAGFIAQMIDGALGMAYGVSASTFLLSFGVPPAAASASIHTSEIFTSGVSGLMHLRFQNVNKKLFKTLLIPGVIGAAAGAFVLSSLEE